MPTANFYIGEADGWVQVATAPDEVRVTGAPHSHPYYLYAGATPPAAGVEGILMCHHEFHTYNAMTENLYARIINPVPNSKQLNGKIRLDVFTI